MTQYSKATTALSFIATLSLAAGCAPLESGRDGENSGHPMDAGPSQPSVDDGKNPPADAGVNESDVQNSNEADGGSIPDHMPVLFTLSGPQSAISGESIALHIELAEDVGNRSVVSLEWSQTSGPFAALGAADSEVLILTAPVIAEPVDLLFSCAIAFDDGAAKTATLGVRVAPIATADVVVGWNLLGLDLVRASERGPTISGRFMALLNTALYSSWAAYDPVATGWLSDREVDITDWSPNVIATHQQAAMHVAAHALFEEFASGPRTMLLQRHLEINTGEDAEVIRTMLTDAANLLLRTSLETTTARLSEAERWEGTASAELIGQEIAADIISFALSDGSDQTYDYASLEDVFVPTAWALPVPTPAQRDKINFYNETAYTDASGVLFPVYVFPDFNPIIAAEAVNATWDSEGLLTVPTPASVTVNPAIRDGSTRLTSTWQSLTEWGIFPPLDDGGPQLPMTPHWGDVTPFALPTSDFLRPETIERPYLSDGSLNDEFVAQAQQLVEFAAIMQDGAEGGSIQRARSEYWELGDNTEYPPGWWTHRAVDTVTSERLDLKTALRLLLAVSQSVFDAGIASWESKYHFNSVRPYTAINQLFFGSELTSYRGKVLGGTDDRHSWFPYQLRRNFTPPFPDVPSGHSSFSYAASTVMKEVLGTNAVPIQTDPFASRFDKDDGFDGDPLTGNEEITLSWSHLSLAAEEAGISRLYGGIHMMDGNWIGLKFGIQVAHAALRKVDALMNGEAAYAPDADGRWYEDGPTLIFGTMKVDNLHDVEVIEGEGPVAIYGFYGDDTLSSGAGETDHRIELFGGEGLDRFILNGRHDVIIRDFQEGEQIVISSTVFTDTQPGSVSVIIDDQGNTKLLIFSEVVASLDGSWTIGQIDVVIE